MCWQMCPFPHTCPFGSVGGAGWGVDRRQVLPCLSGLGGGSTPTPFPPLFPFGFLCHPLLPNLKLTVFLCLGHPYVPLSYSVSDLPTSGSLSLYSYRPLSVSSCPSLHSHLSGSVGISPTSCSLSLPLGLSVSAFPSPLFLPFCLPLLFPIFSFCSTFHILSFSSLALQLSLSIQSPIRPTFNSTPQCGHSLLGLPFISFCLCSPISTFMFLSFS